MNPQKAFNGYVFFHPPSCLPSRTYKMGETDLSIIYGKGEDEHDVEKFAKEGSYDGIYNTVMEPYKPYETIIMPGQGTTFDEAIKVIKEEGYEEISLRDLLHLKFLQGDFFNASLSIIPFLVASATKSSATVTWSCIPVLSLKNSKLFGTPWRSLEVPPDYGVVGLRRKQ